MWSTNGFRYSKSQFQVSDSWIVEIYSEIKLGRITLKEAAKNVPAKTIDGADIEIAMSAKTLSQIFKDHGHQLPQGRKGLKKEIPETTIDLIIQKKFQLKCGITKLWEHINKEGNKVSRIAVEKVCQDVLHTEKKAKKKEKPRCRYLVSHVNAAWHGDIHYLIFNEEKKYLFALIDDRSRYIVRYGIFDDKTAQRVVEIMKEAVAFHTRPLVYWSDNGSENIADITKQFCTEHGIVHCTTIPGNPQSNGKIEAWWHPLEKRLSSVTSWDEIFNEIADYILIYNTKLPHFSLEKINGFHAYPIEIFFNPDLQYSSIDETTINIDGRGEVSLKKFLHLS